MSSTVRSGSSTPTTDDILRRIRDVVVAGVVLVLASPLLGVAALAIYWNDRGPVLYRRRVLGMGGQEFDAFKLRTMCVDADERLAAYPEITSEFLAGKKFPDDPRVTPCGRVLRRLSIDELPQLLNVLRGEMSLVGPRILHPSEAPRYGDRLRAVLSVRPGLTGLWQVSGRQDLDPETRVNLDYQYIRQRSLGLDLRIILRTIPAALRGRGAY